MSPPGVPHLGIHLVELSFVADCYSPTIDFVLNGQECVHWHYHHLTASAIQELFRPLGSGFRFKRDPALIEALCSLPYFGSEDAYRHSLTVDEAVD